MPASKIISVIDSRGVESSLTVGDLRVQLFRGIQSQYSLAAQAAESLDLPSAKKRSAEILAQLKDGKTPDQRYAVYELEKSETIINTQKNVRLAYANFLLECAVDQMARQGELDPRSKELLTMGKKLMEPGASGQISPSDHRISKLLDTIDKAENGQLDAAMPAVVAEQALAKAKNGYLNEARDDMSVAIERADKNVEKNLTAGMTVVNRFSSASIPELSVELRMLNLRMLTDNELWADSENMLPEILAKAPRLNKDPVFRSLRERVELKGCVVDPYEHLQELTRAFEKKDVAGADAALKRFEETAQEVNKNDRQLKKITEIQTLLTGENNEELKGSLNKELELRKMLQQAPLTAEYLHARLALAAGNYSGAKALLGDLESRHPEFAKQSNLQIDELKKLCDDPKNKKDVWTKSTNIVKELLCDVTAIGAGSATVILTGWSGPAALLAGSGAGALAYTGAKAALFGTDSLTWSTPIWGAVDGMSGGTSALARQGINQLGGALLKREVAERAVLGVGGDVAPLLALEGFELSNAALKSAKIGLNSIAKEVPLSLRARSFLRLPVADSGYTAALSSYRQLRNTNYAMNFGKDCLSAGAGAFVYNTGRGVADYQSGRETDIGLVIRHVATNSFRDSLMGGLMGPVARQNKFVEGDIGRYFRLPELAEPIFGSTSPHAADLVTDTDTMANAWIDYCRSQRRPTNEQIFDRYAAQLTKPNQ